MPAQDFADIDWTQQLLARLCDFPQNGRLMARLVRLHYLEGLKTAEVPEE